MTRISFGANKTRELGEPKTVPEKTPVEDGGKERTVKGYGAIVADGSDATKRAANPTASERAKTLADVVATIRESIRCGSEKELLSRLSILAKGLDLAHDGILPIGEPSAVAGLSEAEVENARAVMREALGAFGSVLFENSVGAVDAREVRELGYKMATFIGELETAAGVDDLRALAAQYEGKWLPAQCHTLMLTAFNKADAWGDLAAYYESTAKAQPSFAEDELGHELYIVALNKSAEALPKQVKRLRKEAGSARDPARKQELERQAVALEAKYAPAVATAAKEALSYVHELAAKDLGELPDFSPTTENVPTAPHLNGEVLAGLGKSFRLIASGALNADTRALVEQEWGKAALGAVFKPGEIPADFDYAHAALQLSTQFYEAGFVRDFEYYPGINGVYNNYELADVARAAGDEAKADWYTGRADNMAKLVAAGTQRAGGMYSKDYWCLATQTELALINGDAAALAQVFPVMVESAKYPWEVNSTLSQIKKLAERRGPNHPTAALFEFAISKFEELIGGDGWSGRLGEYETAAPAAKKAGTIDALEQELGDWKASRLALWSRELDRLRGATGRDALVALRQEVTRQLNDRMTSLAIFNTSHTSGGVVQMVGGNHAYNGQITNMTATRETFRLLKPVWQKKLGLGHERNLDKVDQIIDRHINRHFGLIDENGRRPYEDLHSSEHTSILDPYQRKRFDWAQVPPAKTLANGDKLPAGDDRCDLAVIYAGGIGDCRDVGNVKSAMVIGQFMDVDREIMTTAFDAGVGHLQGGPTQAVDSARFAAAVGEMAGRLKVDYGIMDVTIFAPVDNDGMYDWKVDENGNAIPKEDGKFDAIENHRFTVRKVFADDGTIARIEIRDAFYKDIFGFEHIAIEGNDLQAFLHPEGFPAGFMGITTADGRRIPIKIAPTRWSGNGVVETTVTDLLFMGKPVALSADSLLTGSDRIRDLAHQIAKLKLGDEKAAQLLPLLTTRAGFDGMTAQAHDFWYSAQQAAVANQRDPFAGYAQKMVTAADARNLSKDDLSRMLGVPLTDAKFQSISRAADDAVIADPRFKTFSELQALAGLDEMRAAGSASISAMALSLYLADWRQGEDASHVLHRLAEGHPSTTEDFARFLHITQVAAAHVGGERGIDAELPDTKAGVGVEKRAGRDDFVPFCELADDQKGLDWEYGAKPNIVYLQTLTEGRSGDAESFLLDLVRGVYGDETAAYQHNVGWKASKDKALADPMNPFLGWASKRLKVNDDTKALAVQGKEALAEALGIDASRITDEKLAAIQKADGGDIVHHLFKEYHETLEDHPDGGLRIGGQNEAPVGVIANYLLSFRRDDVETIHDLRKVLAGMLDGTDRRGAEDLPKLIHAAFQAEQLVWGDRPYENEVPTVLWDGSTRRVEANQRFRPASDLSEAGRDALEREVGAAIRGVTGQMSK